MGNGNVFTRNHGYEEIRESDVLCSVEWFEADNDPGTELPDPISVECDAINVRTDDAG